MSEDAGLTRRRPAGILVGRRRPRLPRSATAGTDHSDRYKWIALTNTTVGVMLATIDMSIILISMPAIFRGIHLDPLDPGNSFFLLWMLLGYAAVGSILLVSLGRLGDQFGRVRIYNLGFVIYTAASLILSLDPFQGKVGASWLLGFRLVQGLGGACLVANAAAILTDAFPVNQRGFALGINTLAAMTGSFIGLVIGGVLAPVDWRLIFFISVPFGLFGTIWAYLKLQDRGIRTPSPIDWKGNLTFAGGLLMVMIAVTYGIQPYGGHAMGWTSPKVLGCAAIGVALLVLFFRVEARVPHPMFRTSLFRIRAFLFGSTSTFLAALARGGLQFMLVIWLQGIWLPLHGVGFDRTPMLAGLCVLPTTFGMVLAAPISGRLSDRYGSRQFATAGMIGAACAFFLLLHLPVDFSYPFFALTLFLSGMSMGTFNSPNRAGVMNSLPRRHRGAGSGMNSTFQNSAQVFSQGIFFSLMILGLSAALPKALGPGLQAHGVPATVAQHVSHQPPVAVLFATFLGYNPLQHLLGPHVLSQLPASQANLLVSREYFPHLISAPFRSGLHKVFYFSIAICLIAAATSWFRGRRYIAQDDEEMSTLAEAAPTAVAAAAGADPPAASVAAEPAPSATPAVAGVGLSAGSATARGGPAAAARAGPLP
jgi:MFS family permease